MEQLKAKHTDNWKQVVAAIIAENTESDKDYDESFDDENDVCEYLVENYDINYYA